MPDNTSNVVSAAVTAPKLPEGIVDIASIATTVPSSVIAGPGGAVVGGASVGGFVVAAGGGDGVQAARAPRTKAERTTLDAVFIGMSFRMNGTEYSTAATPRPVL